jgi:phospholipid/cholesterol/gamma-HCH transport system substrate-binding protein
MSTRTATRADARTRTWIDARARRLVALLAAAAVIVAVVVVAVVNLVSGDPTYRITAQFPETPGLYDDNAVDILGVPTGHIVSVTPHAGFVDVVLSLPTHVKIPASAKAVLVAPNPVSDRFVELTPPYTGGRALAHGATITLANTVVPLEIDQIFASVDQLSTTLGPSGANSDGELSDALHALATLADGNGAAVHTAITTIAHALPALTAHPDQLTQLIDGMDTITRSLASRNATISSLYGDIATVTSQFAGERTTIAAAIANLQSGLSQVAAFIKANQTNLGSTVKSLATTVSAVMSEQHALIETFSTAALGFQNFNNAIDTTGPCLSATAAPHDCPVLWGRLDLPTDAAALVKEYCGGNVALSILPIVAATVGLSSGSAADTACGAQIGLLQGRTGPPGSPKAPDLDLTHYLGSR